MDFTTTLWPDYYEAHIHTERRGRWHLPILGHRLRPFSPYHALWLEAVRSPFWGMEGQGRKPTLADLDLAAALCACDYGQAPDVLRRRPSRLRKWAFTLRVFLQRGQFERWAAYRADYLSPPHRTAGFNHDPSHPLARHGITVTREKKGPQYRTLPDPLLLVAGLMHLGHVPLRDAWMMPWSQAEWLLHALRHQTGEESTVTNEHSRTFMQGFQREKQAQSVAGVSDPGSTPSSGRSTFLTVRTSSNTASPPPAAPAAAPAPPAGP